MIEVVRGGHDKPVASEQLDSLLRSRDLEGMLFLGYPLTGAGQAVDALLVCKEHGVVIFDLVEGTEQSDRTTIQDELFNLLQAHLLSHKSLTRRRKLLVDITPVTFAPGWSNRESEFYLTTSTDVNEFFEALPQWEHTELFQPLLSVVQVATRIRSRAHRRVEKEDSRGARITKLEESIATLDREQAKAVIETYPGFQRIRGLAGSGKTIVLAMKVAYLHAYYPDWRIAVTFHTRSLKQQFKELITRFTIDQIRTDPDWDRIQILHSWGSSASPGIYYETCKTHGVQYYDYRNAKKKDSQDPFNHVCEEVLGEIGEFKPQFDAILVDEAQDLPTSFLRICQLLTREPHRLVIAYDELQKLNESDPIEIEAILGEGVQLKNEDGKPKQDIILDTCYRNSRPVLTTAHALGFGLEYGDGPVQMFPRPHLWTEVGYEIAEGTLDYGAPVALRRNDRTSPRFLENIDNIDELIKCVVFDTYESQIDWVAKEIATNIKEQELTHRDILVIYADPIHAESKLGELRKRLFEENIKSHTVGVSTSPDDFLRDNSVACTGIYRAKGNEAAMVYVIDSQYCL